MSHSPKVRLGYLKVKSPKSYKSAFRRSQHRYEHHLVKRSATSNNNSTASQHQQQPNLNLCLNSQQSCCLQHVEIDLQELGWTDILAPIKLNYTFCQGSCSPEVVNPHLFTSAAAQLLYRLNQGHSSIQLGAPCCSPRAHAPVDLVFINRTASSFGPEAGMTYLEIEKVTIPDMLVTQCGCS